MRCPFLKEAEGRFCEIAPFRKMILRVPRPEDHEICSSPEYVRCPSLAGRPGIPAGGEGCPFLQVALLQYCEAAPVAPFIPYSEALHSPCQSDGYRSCDVYLSLADPERRGAGKPGIDDSPTRAS